MSDVRYYVLFANYEQGLKLHGILDGAGVQNRIAPAPRCIQGELSCGMSLLIEKEHIDEARGSHRGLRGGVSRYRPAGGADEGA